MNIIKFNNSILKYYGKWLETDGTPTPVDPYNPLNLPANTVRVRTRNGEVPYKAYTTSYETATPVSGTTDVYDVYKSGTSFRNLLLSSYNVVEVLGANTTGITDMSRMLHSCPLTNVALFDTSNVTTMESMFYNCETLPTVPLFDTSNVTDMKAMFEYCDVLTTVPLFNTSKVTSMLHMFNNCTSLTTVPLFDTSNVTDMTYTFAYCKKVQSGALALYQQASRQANPPTAHIGTFYNCGTDTVTGTAELEQIPIGWKSYK